MNHSWLLAAVALLIGALITVQTGSNARLKEAFGEALPAVIVSSSLGIILLAVVTIGVRTPWPSWPILAGAPWWGWVGGALGAIYAVVAVLLARELGAAPLTALVVTGQLVCSVVARPLWLGGLHRARAGDGARHRLPADDGRIRPDRALLSRAQPTPGERGSLR